MRTSRSKIAALPAIGLLVLSGWACSYLRPKPKLTWHMTLQVDAPDEETVAATRQSISIIKTRLNAAGVPNFDVKPEGDAPQRGRILLDLPTTKDQERIAKIITEQGKLELVAVVSPPSPAPTQTFATREEAIASLNGTIPTNRRVLPYDERPEIAGQPHTKWVVVEAPAIIDGSDLRDASASRAAGGGDEYDIRFSLGKTGANKFGAWTGSHINQYIGVALNDEVRSIAYIKSQITDEGQISGRYNKQNAEDLALVLKSGQLPARLRVVDEKFDHAK